ncbi:MAG: metal-dependent hydrolase, partial [Vicinamibacterales bacterium]
MDNVTHTLVAATLGRTALSRLGRGTTAALILGSNAPDIDVLATAGGTLAYLDWHRGVTHGVLGVVVLGLISAALVRQALRWMARSDGFRPSTSAPASFQNLVAVAMLGAAIHVCMDLPTSYGTRVLSPFDERWFTTDWMPIVDAYLLGILAAGLALGRSPRLRQPAAIAVLVLMAGNYALRAVTHGQAFRSAP